MGGGVVVGLGICGCRAMRRGMRDGCTGISGGRTQDTCACRLGGSISGLAAGRFPGGSRGGAASMSLLLGFACLCTTASRRVGVGLRGTCCGLVS